MPSVLPPKLRWRPSALPLLEAGLDPIERAQRVIAGSLILWSSRATGFSWADHIDSEMTFRYCVARINGDREAPRPTVYQLRACLVEVGDHIDAEAYQALNILALSLDAKSRNSSRGSAELTTDFFGLDGEPLGDGVEEDSLVERKAGGYGKLGEPPAAAFVNSRPSAEAPRRPVTAPPTATSSMSSLPPAPPMLQRQSSATVGAGHLAPRVAPPSARPPEARRPEERRSSSATSSGRPAPQISPRDMREPVDSLQHSRDAHEARAAQGNSPSMMEQVGAAAKGLQDSLRALRGNRR